MPNVLTSATSFRFRIRSCFHDFAARGGGRERGGGGGRCSLVRASPCPGNPNTSLTRSGFSIRILHPDSPPFRTVIDGPSRVHRRCIGGASAVHQRCIGVHRCHPDGSSIRVRWGPIEGRQRPIDAIESNQRNMDG